MFEEVINPVEVSDALSWYLDGVGQFNRPWLRHVQPRIIGRVVSLVHC